MRAQDGLLGPSRGAPSAPPGRPLPCCSLCSSCGAAGSLGWEGPKAKLQVGSRSRTSPKIDFLSFSPLQRISSHPFGVPHACPWGNLQDDSGRPSQPGGDRTAPPAGASLSPDPLTRPESGPKTTRQLQGGRCSPAPTLGWVRPRQGGQPRSNPSPHTAGWALPRGGTSPHKYALPPGLFRLGFIGPPFWVPGSPGATRRVHVG